MNPLLPNVVAIPDHIFITTMHLYDPYLNVKEIQDLKIILVDKLNAKLSFKTHSVTAGFIGQTFILKYEKT